MNTKYTFDDGEITASVDRQREIITMDERSGWGRTYTITFAELVESANNWDIKLDLNNSDEIVAEIASNIILANNAAEHNLDPFQYVPKSNKVTDPRDKKAVQKFENLFNKYTANQIITAMSGESKQALKEALMKS